MIWTYGDKLRLKPLPVLVAANGHVYFYQHLPEKCGLPAHRPCLPTGIPAIHYGVLNTACSSIYICVGNLLPGSA